METAAGFDRRDARQAVEHWLRWKLKNDDFVLPDTTDDAVVIAGNELRVETAEADDGAWVLRVRLYEPHQGTDEEVKTTLTALDVGDGPWVWVDLERWSERAWERAWVPLAPGLVSTLLRRVDCHRGATALPEYMVSVDRRGAPALAMAIADPQRVVPLVVVSPSKTEREVDMLPTRERARHLSRHLRGIARVSVLEPGATTALSKALLGSVGPDMDVHSGGIRTYLPPTSNDRASRHRVIPYRRLEDRSNESLARMVVPELVRAACLQQPPPGWRARAAAMLSEETGVDREEHELIDTMLVEAERERDLAQAARDELEFVLEIEREELSSALSANNDLDRRVRYLERVLREKGVDDVHGDDEPAFDPEFCAEVVEQAQSLPGLALGAAVAEGAEELDGHGVRSWAQKAWRALTVLDAYARRERTDGSGSADFRTWLESGPQMAVPTTWVAMHESETTNTNERFRNLRTLPVDTKVDASGSVYMPAHIKIEAGGYPAPRIHFYDDTEGETGKVHIGWFGPHLDNAAKS